jgi:cytoskeletal protein CcmA (bactofilin family)
MNGKIQAKPAAASPGGINAFLGEGAEFKGILTFEGTVRIDGKLEGEVITRDTLVVGEHAEVKAEINAGTAVISGTVRGNVTATVRIEAHRPARIHGNLKTPVLIVEEGVLFEGSCSMGEKEPKPKG